MGFLSARHRDSPTTRGVLVASGVDGGNDGRDRSSRTRAHRESGRARIATVARGSAVARRRTDSRVKPKPQEKRVGRVLTVRVFIFSMMSSVAADMATTPVRRAALTEKAEALNALTGAPYATCVRNMGGRGQRRKSGISPPLPRRGKSPWMPPSRAAVSGRETRGEDTNLGGGLGSDGGLHAEGRGHGGHGRHSNVRVCGVRQEWLRQPTCPPEKRRADVLVSLDNASCVSLSSRERSVANNR